MDLNELGISALHRLFSLQRAAGQVDFDRISGNGLAAVGIPANDSKAFAAAIHRTTGSPIFRHGWRRRMPGSFACAKPRPVTGAPSSSAAAITRRRCWSRHEHSRWSTMRSATAITPMSSDWYWSRTRNSVHVFLAQFEEVTGVPSAQGLGKTRWGGLGKERLSDVDWEAHRQMLCSHQTFRNFSIRDGGQTARSCGFASAANRASTATGALLAISALPLT